MLFLYRLQIFSRRGMAYITFKNAGHKVPLHVPDAALFMFQGYLSDDLEHTGGVLTTTRHTTPKINVTLI